MRTAKWLLVFLLAVLPCPAWAEPLVYAPSKPARPSSRERKTRSPGIGIKR